MTVEEMVAYEVVVSLGLAEPFDINFTVVAAGCSWQEAIDFNVWKATEGEYFTLAEYLTAE